MMAKKEEEEKALRAEVARRPELQQSVGSAWDEIAKRLHRASSLRQAHCILDPVYSRLGQIASTLVRYAEEVGKPNDERYDEFRDSKLESLKFGLFSPPRFIQTWKKRFSLPGLAEAEKTLGADDPFVRAALQGSTPGAVAKAVVGGTKLGDVAVRKALFEGGARSD